MIASYTDNTTEPHSFVPALITFTLFNLSRSYVIIVTYQMRIDLCIRNISQHWDWSSRVVLSNENRFGTCADTAPSAIRYHGKIAWVDGKHTGPDSFLKKTKDSKIDNSLLNLPYFSGVCYTLMCRNYPKTECSSCTPIKCLSPPLLVGCCRCETRMGAKLLPVYW